MIDFKKSRIFILALVSALLLLILLCGCSALDKDYTVTDAYFDTVDVKTETDPLNNTKITFEIACALPLTKYTYSFDIYDREEAVVYTCESTTVNKQVEANKKIIIEQELDEEIRDKADHAKITISGISKKNPAKLKRERFTVTYMCNGEEYKTEEVRGGRSITTTVGKDCEGLVFCGWYFDPSYSFRAYDTDKIYRNKTLYAKYIIEAETVANEVATTAMKSLVNVTYKFNNSTGYGSGSGSGVIFKTVDNKHYVLTNAHVVQHKDFAPYGYDYYVEDCYGNRYDAYQCLDESNRKIISEEYDLACLYFYAYNDIGAIELADSDITVGENCISLGTPLEQKNAATYGHVRYIKQRWQSLSFDVICHSAIVTNGCSGGPLLNSKLQLVGINYAKINDGQEFTTGLAIPLSKVLEFLSAYPELSIE